MTDLLPEILDTRAVCARLVAELGESYRLTPRRLLQLVNRDRDPLPTVAPVSKGKPARYDWDEVLQWFEAEMDRQSQTAETAVVSLAEGIQLSISAFAREIGKHPQTVSRIVNDWNIKPVETRPGRGGDVDYYRLRDLLEALTAATAESDPDSLPATERDAYYRGELRKDELHRNRRELVPVDEALKVFNALVAPLRDAFDLLPDALERKARLAPEALSIVESVGDDFRRQLAKDIVSLQERLRISEAEQSESAISQ